MISKVYVTEEMKRQMYIKRLIEKKVFVTREGLSIYELDYESLRREVALLEFMERNIDSSENAWF